MIKRIYCNTCKGQTSTSVTTAYFYICFLVRVQQQLKLGVITNQRSIFDQLLAEQLELVVTSQQEKNQRKQTLCQTRI